ncbi:Toluene-4-sulfonate monooxygenase system iron-sulfur subunit TsaM1 [Thalassovita gelatinovora]|uniref:Toluene-4-sulfonate monooxygenase system iron-sulfur subunit TsaM1 n=1 Tax=Thalassovita gelatinovora TaxID=53501 RepID=A0A0N7LVN1_THAGE|nr:aromatic ring-hydroxylating dioxygenase subunit alpha [Thalassovita gelatinovora]QIZ79751.1 aromatic ring-hydroxylating dioxygenase subunit alpha [Thalassovita gelatinovora]CUH66762.1 Toluene-4-sulfonate monooxygenase system iron-sulfur subunit TsaM1 [Thalassovita gelatinovora]SEQ42313.1 vanillate O-demethylase monooxygenase subunit [Thalassovita gelatinovora]
MSFVRNAWYVAGWSSEFGDDLHALEIIGQSLVLFRDSAGAIKALEDRCPHRLLPLSKGKRIGDTIQCGYHGMTFDGRGTCVRVPGQDNTPQSANVDAFEVEERHGIVWVWMGAPDRADRSLIFDLPEFSDSNWHTHHGGHLHIKSHYLNVAENLVDPAHVSFVHPTTLGNSASEDVPVHVSTSGDVIRAWRWIRNGPPIGFFQKFGGFKGNVDRWHYYDLHLPSTAVIDFGSIDTDLNCPEEERDRGVRIFAIHFVTPVSEDYTIDHWMHLRNTAQGDQAASEQMDAMFNMAFAEDKEILEAVHEAEKRPQRRRPIRIAIDKGPNVYRKRIRDLVAAETTEDLGDPVRPVFIEK